MEMTQDSQLEGAGQTAGASSQYLTFRLAEETYAIGILKVREILRFEELTKVPSIPDSIRGVLNLRGSVVPVVDLVVKFGLPKSDITQWTCIVIVETCLDGEDTIMGILADSVSEVLDLKAGDIEPPPPFGTKVYVDYLIGMGKSDRRFILILDIDKVLSVEEATLVSDALEAEESEDSSSSFADSVPSSRSVEGAGSEPEEESSKADKLSQDPTQRAISERADNEKGATKTSHKERDERPKASEKSPKPSNAHVKPTVPEPVQDKRAATVASSSLEKSKVMVEETKRNSEKDEDKKKR